MLFEMEISGEAGAYQVEVLHSEGGGRPREQLVLDPVSILSRRTELENAVLASSVQSRRVVPAAEEPLRIVGQQLFEALFTGHVYGAYRASLGAAQQQQKRLGVVLRIVEPELAALPWEALFDPETEEYLCRSEPLIRHVDAPYTAEPLEVSPPLRILGLVASPRGLPILDVAAERQRLEEALAKPRAAGLVDLAWAPDVSWEGIHEQMLSDTWHILHFVGHGDYDVIRQEGVLALVGPDGGADLIEAGRLRDLLCEAEPTPRLVVLNSCSSGEAGVGDLFSGTAAALVQRGISAVAAMQFSITDAAAIRFARGFYTAIAHGRPVDEAVRSGRVGILGSARTLEWITPVLYVKTDSSQLFRLTGMPVPQRGTGPAGEAPQPDLPAGATPAAAPTVTTVIAPDTSTGAGSATAAGTGTATIGHPAGRAGRAGEKRPGPAGPGPGPRLRRRWLLVAGAVAAAATVLIGLVVTAGLARFFQITLRLALPHGVLRLHPSLSGQRHHLRGQHQRSRVRAERQHRRIPVEISARPGDRRRVLPPGRGRPHGLRGQRQRPYLRDQGPGRRGRLVEPVRRERRRRPVQPGLRRWGGLRQHPGRFGLRPEGQ